MLLKLLIFGIVLFLAFRIIGQLKNLTQNSTTTKKKSPEQNSFEDKDADDADFKDVK